MSQIKRFTIDGISKYYNKFNKNLIEMLFLFPNFGEGFKIYMKRRVQDYYLIDHVNIKNHRHGKIFGMFYKNGVPVEKDIKKIRKTLQDGRWLFEPPVGIYTTENGLEYDIVKTQKLIEEKKEILNKRHTLLEKVDFRKQKKIEEKEAKNNPKKKKK